MVYKGIEKGDFIAILIRNRHIQREGIAGCVEFTVLTHAIAEPPFTAWTHTAVMILFTLSEVGTPAVKFLILFRIDLEPCLGLLVVDPFYIVLVLFHKIVSFGFLAKSARVD